MSSSSLSFCKKRKFISESNKNNLTTIPQQQQQHYQQYSQQQQSQPQPQTSSSSFLSKRKYSQHSGNSFQNNQNLEMLELANSFVEITNNMDGCVLSMWFEFANILHLRTNPSCIIQSEHLFLLTQFIINRYLNFMISIATLNDEESNIIQSPIEISQEQSSQNSSQNSSENNSASQEEEQQKNKGKEELLPYWKILNHLKTSGSLRRISLDLCEMIHKSLNSTSIVIFDNSNDDNNENNENNENNNDNNNNNNNDDNIRFKLWLNLGILESACFQNPLNQVRNFFSNFVLFVLLSYYFINLRDIYQKKFQKKLNFHLLIHLHY